MTVVCSASQTVVDTFAGSGALGASDGIASQASFNQPGGVAVDSAGNVYVADLANQEIRKITPAGNVTTLAGHAGSTGTADGDRYAASFKGPTSVAVDADGNVYVSDQLSHRVRKITPAGVVSTLAGSEIAGSADGHGAAATFGQPAGLAVDAVGNLYVADRANNRIRKISPAGDVVTLAGSGVEGATDGSGVQASFSEPVDVAVDSAGNVYVADAWNNRIRKITPAGNVTTLAGSGLQGAADGVGASASFFRPFGIAVDRAGYVYVTDSGNNRIRRISPLGFVTTLAGTGAVGSTNGSAATASFYSPSGVAVDGSGIVYVGDGANNLIRRITSSLAP